MTTDRTSSHQPDLLSFNLALAACARNGEAAKTLRLLGDMRKAGLLPTTVSFSTAVKSCERAGRADEVSYVATSIDRWIGDLIGRF